MPWSLPTWTNMPAFLNNPVVKMAVASAVTSSPSIYFFSHFVARNPADLMNLFRTYALAGIVGIPVSMLLQSLLSYPLALICFGSHKTAIRYLVESTKQPDSKDAARAKLRKQMSQNPRYWLFILGFCFVAAALVEESVKYAAITMSLGNDKLSPLARRGSGHVLVAAAAGLGFATVENIAFLISSAVDEVRKNKRMEKQPGPSFAVSMLERLVFGIPGHCMTAMLTGANIALRGSGHQSWSFAEMWQVIGPSVLFHGTWNSALLATSAWEGHVGWVHPSKGAILYTATGMMVALQCALGMLLWEKLKLC